MMDMHIFIVDHRTQRYDTVGDWVFEPNGDMTVHVSNMKNEDYEFLVGLHEQIEAYLCKKRGIKEEDVTAFDIKYESDRPEGNTDEPGNHPLAPYFNEHVFATKIEKLIADELKVNWEDYDAVVNSL